jgi:hypothetical protein
MIMPYSHHGKGFPRSCLSVGEDTAIITFQALDHADFAHSFEYYFLLFCFPDDLIESKRFHVIPIGQYESLIE